MTREIITEPLALEKPIGEIISALEIYVKEIREANKKHDLPTDMQGFGGISNVIRKAPRWQLVGVEAETDVDPVFFGPDM